MTDFVTVSSDAWTKVSDGAENVLITHGYVWPLHVFRGLAAPAAGAGYHSITADQSFSMSGIIGQKIYARSGKAGASMVIAVDAV